RQSLPLIITETPIANEGPEVLRRAGYRASAGKPGDQQRADEPARGRQCASDQLLPDPASATSGTDRVTAPSMTLRTTSDVASTWASGTSNSSSSWICSSIWASSFLAAIASGTR